MNSNSILIIAPYRYQGQWVFDDANVGLVREPFICGIDTMIDKLVKDIPNSESGFRLIFSANPFPNYAVELEWLRSEHGGNWYHSKKFEMDGWLCPALFKYFDTAPLKLFGRAEPKSV